MRFLIVDDDPVICEGTIRRLREMDFLQASSFQQAYSAETALALARKYRYDVLLTDIRMAEMDGLTLVEEVKKSNVDLLCVIITAYDDFRYAKRALPLGVIDFLVKPLSEAEMTACMRTVALKYQDLKAERRILLERELCRMCDRKRASMDVRALFGQFDVELPQGTLYVLAWEHETPMPETSGLPAALIPSERSFALCVSQSRGEEVLEWAEQLVKTHRQSVGMSLPVQDVAQGYAQAMQMLNERWYARDPRVYRAEEAPNAFDAQRAQSLRDMVGKLQIESWKDAMTELLLHASPSAASQYMDVCIEEMLQIARSMGMRDEFHAPLQFYAGWPTILDRLASEMAQIRDAQLDSESYRVMCAKRYVKEHLSEQIDMAVVANQLNMSYAYFSRIFRKETGRTFSEYILDKRLEETCHLLLMGERLVDIAAKLGYQNPGNLTRSFTKKYGISPSKWLKRASCGSKRNGGKSL